MANTSTVTEAKPAVVMVNSSDLVICSKNGRMVREASGWQQDIYSKFYNSVGVTRKGC